jgi:hypothetical protein
MAHLTWSKAPTVVTQRCLAGDLARLQSSGASARLERRRSFGLVRTLATYQRMGLLRVGWLWSALANALLGARPHWRPRAYHVLFSVVATIVQGDAATLRRRLRSIDGRTLLAIARREGCAGILADGLVEFGAADVVDPRLQRALRAERWFAALRAVMLRRQVDDVVALLRRHGIIPILLRQAHDIGLVLPADRLDAATQVLRQAGYTQQFIATDAGAVASRVQYVDGATGTIGVLDDVGSALHLAMRAREPTAPLRDLFLLAQRLRSMVSDQREALRATIDGAGADGLRLHATVYGAAQLAGVAWQTPRVARRSFERWLRRDDAR